MSDQTKSTRSKWSDAESSALEKAFLSTTTAEDFFKCLRDAVPEAPHRTVKAYLSRLCMLYPDKSVRTRPVYLDLLNRASAEEVAAAEKSAVAATQPPLTKTDGTSWLDELDPTPSAPTQPPKPAPAPNFVKPVAKPDPNARVPRHIPVPPASKLLFTSQEAATALGVQLSAVKHAMSNNHLPHRQFKREGVKREGDSVEGPFIIRPVFDVLHEALSEGHSFEHAFLLAMGKFPPPAPIVPAEKLYAPTVENSPVEPDPNKVREGYIPNPFLKGPFPIEKKQEASTLDDPNPDAKEAFTVEEAAKALGLSNTDTVLTAIHRDGFPAVKVDGKWCLTRADLKRVHALRDSGFSLEGAFKRAGAPPAGEPTTAPDDTSWTDHLAPLTPEEVGLAAALPDVVDRDPVWGAVSLEALANELHIHVASVYQGVSDHPLVQKHGDDLGVPRQAFDLIEEKWRKCRNLEEAFDYAAEKLGVLPPPAPATGTGDERVWTLEAIRDGVFTVEQARDILGLKDAARTNWALGLLAAGKVTLDQAAKLLR